MNCADVRKVFERTEPNQYGMVEVLGISFEADEPCLFGTVSDEYVTKEINWYNSQYRNIKGLEPDVPKIWKHIASEDGDINSNYGWCIYSAENGSQYKNVLRELSFNPDSRRGIMIYNRPNMHTDAHRKGMNDFMCTNAVSYHIDKHTLVAVVQMRSNDIIFGYKNDYAWQRHVIDKLAKDLGITETKIMWQVASLHMYPQHVERFL